MRLDLARIAVPRQRRQLVAHCPAKQPLAARPGERRASCPMVTHADIGQPRLGDRADAPHQLDRQVVKESRARSRDRQRPARRAWPPARRFSPGAWCAPRPPRSAAPAPPARGGESSLAISTGGPKRRVAAGDVGKRFIDGDALDERREIAEHLDRGIAQPLVLLEVAADENAAAGRARAPAVPAFRRAPRKPWLRRKRRARRRRRRRWACRAGTGPAAARPRRRRRPGPHGGWWPSCPCPAGFSGPSKGLSIDRT